MSLQSLQQVCPPDTKKPQSRNQAGMAVPTHSQCLLKPVGSSRSSKLPTVPCILKSTPCSSPILYIPSTKDLECGSLLSLLSQASSCLSHPKSCQLILFFPVPVVPRQATVLWHKQPSVMQREDIGSDVPGPSHSLAQKLVLATMGWKHP